MKRTNRKARRILAFMAATIILLATLVTPGIASDDTWNTGGFDSADVYIADNHSEESDILGYSGNPNVPNEPEEEVSISFTFDGALYISPSEYSEEAKQELFLAGVSAVNEKAEPVTEIRVEDFGGFDIEAEPDTEFIITYAANHANGEAFTATREAYVIADEVPEVEANISFTFDGALYISPSEYSEEAKQELFLAGVSAINEKDEPVTEIRVEDFGGFDIEAEPDTEFIITYAATHANGETFTATREAYVVADEKAPVFDPQPTSIEEVQALIDAYEAAYQAALTEGGFMAALEVQKPHWEFEVAAELMPEGWECQLVDGDEDFGEDYWTFFPGVVAASGPVDNEAALRNAITAAPAGGIVEIENDIELSSILEIKKEVTITSTADNQFKLIGMGDFTNITVNSGGNLTLANIVVTHGSEKKGCGVYVDNNSNLTLEDGGEISGNISSNPGGGVFLSGGAFVMNGGIISNNTAYRHGGGVYVYRGTFNMSGGEISSNNLTGDNNPEGGGVYIEAGYSFTMNDGKISNNTARQGGGVFANGTFTMEGGEISGNTATNGGGGVYTQAGSGTYVGTFIMNGGKIGGNNKAGIGGGVYVASLINVGDVGGVFSMSGTAQISGNQATSDGGGVYIGEDATFTMASGATIGGTSDEGNTAYNGGGLYIAGGSFTLPSGAIISGNTAIVSGGGVFVAGSNSTFVMGDGAISGNIADYGGGGGVYVDSGTFNMNDGAISGNTASNCGGVFVADGTFTMHDGVISGNTGNNGGGVYITGSNGKFVMNDGQISGNKANNNGGGVCANSGIFNMNGGQISDNEAANNGGGVYQSSSATFTMADGAVIGGTADEGNTAKHGGGLHIEDGSFILPYGAIISGNGVTQNGGGVHVSGGTFTLEDGGEISGNTATGSSLGGGGGGVYIQGGIFTMESGGKIINNVAIPNATTGGNGGGVYKATNATFTMASGAVIGGENDGEGNMARRGNGLYIAGGNFTLSHGAKIIGNVPSGSYNNVGDGGGGIYVASGTFTMNGGEISGNRAIFGGGVYVNGNAIFTMAGGEISYNKGDRSDGYGYGGGVYINNNGTFNLEAGGRIIGNTASEGGGVYKNVSGNFTMTSGAIIGGTAEEGNNATGVYTPNCKGGGLYIAGGVFVLPSGAKISGNKSSAYGGGIHLIQGSLTMESGSEVSGNAGGSGAYGGGGICNNRGTFTLKAGAKIIRNKGGLGGGVHQNYEGIFIMESGAIIGGTADEGNIANGNGGGGLYLSGIFTLPTGAQIIGNTTSGRGGGIRGDGTITLETGSEISNNSATNGGGGLHLSSGTWILKAGAKITGNKAGYAGYGGGVLKENAATFIMDSGSVIGGMGDGEGNSAYRGGGLYIDGGEFTLPSGTKIIGNTVTYMGGGLSGFNAAITMEGGEISGNTATPNGEGGGVAFLNGSFTMNGGEISGNTAKNGGGIAIFFNKSNHDTFNVKSGQIINNTATQNGGGISTNYSYLADLNVGAGAIFYGNTAIRDFERSPVDDDLYNAQIAGTNWSDGRSQGYNNYDISYTRVGIIFDKNHSDASGWTVDETLTRKSVDYNTQAGSGTPSWPTNPTRTGYSFLGWNTQPDGGGSTYTSTQNVTSTRTVTLYAKWSRNAYTVIFKDWNETVLKTETVDYGESATAPTNPDTKPNYHFTGWDKTFNNITSNLTVTAQYDINTYTVTFEDWDTTVLKTQTVNYGSSATAPTNPTREGHTFTGWDKAFNNITSNLTVTAQYNINTYTVTFEDWDTTVLKTQTVNHGGSATAPTNPTREGYTFTGWDKPFNNITSDLTVTAQYTIKTYTVTFEDWDTTVLKTQTVNHGSGATAPASPTREGYTFTGWDKDFNNITSNLTVTAQYVANTATVYTVTFHENYDGGSNATRAVILPATSIGTDNMPSFTRTGHTFTSWNTQANGNGTTFDGNTTVTSDIDVYAQWSPIMYTVRFESWNRMLIKSEQVPYGGNATAPSAPYRSDYSFIGWDRSYTNVTMDMTVTALYERNSDDDNDDNDGDGGGGGGGEPTTPAPTPPPTPTPTPTPAPEPIPTPPLPAPGPGDVGGGTTDSDDDDDSDDMGIADTDTNPTSTPDGSGTTDSTPIPAPRNEPTQASVTPELPNREDSMTVESTSPLDETGRWVGDEDTPRISIGGLDIPLFAPFGVGVWALFNLIMGVLGGVAALAIAIRALLKKKSEQDDSENPDEDDKEQKRSRFVWLTTTIIMGIAGIFVFLLTENMSNPMVLVDMWTIVNAVILAVEIVAIIFVFKKAKDDDKQNKGRATDKQNEYISAK